MADDFELRAYCFIDRMQPRLAAFVGTVTQGDLAIEGMAGLYVETAPGNHVFRVVDAAASGQPIRLHGRDVVTSEAAQRAADLGVQIERDQPAGTTSGFATKTSSSAPPATPATPATQRASEADLRRAVRAAVVAELGSEAPGLDVAIDKVMKARPR